MFDGKPVTHGEPVPQPQQTRTQTPTNPYPRPQVWVCWGWGTGWPGKPRGYPCHSLGQSPNFYNSKWHSMWQPQAEYKQYECRLCNLMGHIQYNCPGYKCPIC